MRTGTALVLLLAAGITAPALAEQRPRAGHYDQRVQTVAYNPMQVVRIVTDPTTSTQVAFSDAEEITQVAIGDADAWLAQPAGHFLFFKPIEVRAPTNAQVVTKRPDGSVRSYQLRLVAVAHPGHPMPEGERVARREEDLQPTLAVATLGAPQPPPEERPVFAVIYTYPAEAARAQNAAQAREAAVAADRAAEERLAGSWSEGPRHWRYVAQGSGLIEPSEVSDNGRLTEFRFPGAQRIPTIYTIAPDGTETIVPYTMAGDRAVVQTVAREFRLRDGQEVLRVVNLDFDPIGRDPGTGTGSPNLARVVRSAP